jgi:hypothetical protein
MDDGNAARTHLVGSRIKLRGRVRSIDWANANTDLFRARNLSPSK